MAGAVYASFTKFAKILDGRIAAAAIQIMYEWRAVHRRKHGVLTTNFHVSSRVAGMLGKLRWRRFCQRPHQALGKPDPLTLDIGTGGFPHIKRLAIVAEVDADLLQHGLAIGLDQTEPFFAQYFVQGNFALDVTECLNATAKPHCAAAFGTASGPAASACRSGIRRRIGLCRHDGVSTC